VACVGLFVPVAVCVLLRLNRLVVTSDSVAQQSVVLTWLHAGHGRAYLPPDTWLLKLPVYAVVEALPLAPSVRLAVESISLALLGFALLAVGMRMLIQLALPEGGSARWADVVLPLVWVGTVAGGLGQYLAVMPNSRNVELGLAVVLVAAAARHLHRGSPGGPSRRALLAVAAILGLGVLWVDDPYVAFLVGLPLTTACVAWYAVRRRDRRLLEIAAVLATSLLGIPLLRRVLALVGIEVVPDATGVTLSPGQIASHLPIMWPSLVAELGLREPGGAAGPAHLAILAVLATAVAAAGWLAWYGWRTRDLPLAFVGSHWPVVVAGVLVNRTIYDFHAGRYLVLVVFDLAVSTGLAAALLRPTRPRLAAGIGALLAVATVANLIAVALDRTPRPALGAQQEQTLAVLEGTGATKGFSDFWAADLYTQQSGGGLMVSDVVCWEGRLRLRHWLTDSARVGVPAERTFVLWDPAAPSGLGCPLPGIEAQLGRASRRVPVPAGGYVLIFDGDVSRRIDPA
jgi:hypothetical protein